ncbi:selection and upkeep of intraepithelial T-cells protein 4-like [Saccopteryx leptura]|uniref:selection and upkeep of intraepithelial T-cells protein 4-like n=1 Tax=Saccopteryx leptura TaxID=249018 RepID=UPI00339C6A3B
MCQHKASGSPCLSHPRGQRVSTVCHGSLISLYLCLQMVTGAFQVHGPREPLVAMLGGEAELLCFLLPTQSVKNMQISWFRSLPSQVVHLYQDRRDKPEEAMEEYFGRTELVRNVMHKGIVALRIFNVRPSDNGQYHCAFQHGSFYNDTVVELKVAVLGSNPQFCVEVTKSRQIRLECKSGGWFPKPRVQWMDSEGEEIPAETETYTQDKGGLFHVTTSLFLRESSQKNVTCSVWNPVLNQKKEEQLSTAVAEFICTICTTFIIVVSALATALIMLILIFIGFCLKRNSLKNRHRNSSKFKEVHKQSKVHEQSYSEWSEGTSSESRGISDQRTCQAFCLTTSPNVPVAPGAYPIKVPTAAWGAAVANTVDPAAGSAETAALMAPVASDPDDVPAANAAAETAAPETPDTPAAACDSPVAPESEAPDAKEAARSAACDAPHGPAPVATAEGENPPFPERDPEKAELLIRIGDRRGRSMDPDSQEGQKEGVSWPTLRNKLQPGQVPESSCSRRYSILEAVLVRKPLQHGCQPVRHDVHS